MQFWPVVGWVNHQYVPLQFRVIFHSLIAFGWYKLYLSSAPLPNILTTFPFYYHYDSGVSFFQFFSQGNILESTSKIFDINEGQMNK